MKAQRHGLLQLASGRGTIDRLAINELEVKRLKVRELINEDAVA
jgi:hypothetical protein